MQSLLARVSVILIGLVFLASCSSELNSFVLSGPVMGTGYSVQIVTNKELGEIAKKELDVAVGNRLLQIDNLMSTYKPDSELMKFNALKLGGSVDLSSDTQAVLELSIDVFKRSRGFFDPSIGPLVSRWGFGPDKSSDIPNQEEVATLLSEAGMKHFQLNSKTGEITKLSKGFIDFSAIAKGYAVDQVSKLLAELDYSNYLVEVGGEVYARGVNKHQKTWRLGIEQPDFVGRKAYTVVNLANKAMATSGDYRNFFEVGGTRYSHTIDPKTGFPVASSIASVTVVHELCALADAWATALNAMGFEAALSFAEENKISAYFIVRKDGLFEAYSSSRFEGLVN
jgi:FAD:protein FMN transferase